MPAVDAHQRARRERRPTVAIAARQVEADRRADDRPGHRDAQAERGVLLADGDARDEPGGAAEQRAAERRAERSGLVAGGADEVDGERRDERRADVGADARTAEAAPRFP